MATLSGWNKRESSSNGPTRGVDVNQMQKELEDYKEQLEAAKNEVKVQQGKNDDLRSKNWKAMEALGNLERLYQKNTKGQNSRKPQNKGNNNNNSSSGPQPQNPKKNKSGKGRNQNEAEEAQKTFLLQLFDDVINVNDGEFENKSHKEWLDAFSDKIKSWKRDLDKDGGNKNNETNPSMNEKGTTTSLITISYKK